MDNPGCFNLADLQIGAATAAAGSPQTATVNLDGMTATTLDFDFSYGSGGSTCSAVVQTSLNGGTKWRDIARKDFATTSETWNCNLEGLLSKGMTQYVPLASTGVYDGVLGNQLRCVVISTGTYVGTMLTVIASVR